jgi:chorismate mutase
LSPKKVELDIAPLLSWFPVPGRVPVIAGPCSAETFDQVMEDAKAIAALGQVGIFRSGVWKPRTRPNSFEGNGIKALEWLLEVRKQTGLLTTVEVANTEHVEDALKFGVDILWIGARTSVNPFSVQEIADSLKGVDIPVLIKNPINPDLNLWIGALERVNQAGIKKMAAIHRGFNNYESSHYRNSPRWEIPIQLMTAVPNIPVICDPSHITGNREWVPEVAQKGMNLGMHGLMIETHPDPEKAWSDADQQVTPAKLGELIGKLVIRQQESADAALLDRLMQLRRIIDSIDEELLQILAKRLKVIEEIGEHKKDHNITIFQLERWNEILNTRGDLATKINLDSEFVKRIMSEIHKESIQIQTDMLNQEGVK